MELCRGCYFQIGENVMMEMSVESAYGKSIETLFNWISREVNMSKTEVIFRTYAPVHFRLFPCCVCLLNFCILFRFLIYHFCSLVNPALVMIGKMPPISWLPLLLFLFYCDFLSICIWRSTSQAFFSGSKVLGEVWMFFSDFLE